MSIINSQEQALAIDASAKLILSGQEILAAVPSFGTEALRLVKTANLAVPDELVAPPVVLVVMNGGLFFAASLLPHLGQCVVDSVRAVSYASRTSSLNVQVVAKPSVSLMGRQVILVDDIYDSGNTATALTKYCLQEGATHVWVATMLAREDHVLPPGVRSMLRVPADQFLFGFGLDYDAGVGRNLPDVYGIPS